MTKPGNDLRLMAQAIRFFPSMRSSGQGKAIPERHSALPTSPRHCSRGSSSSIPTIRFGSTATVSLSRTGTVRC